MRAAALPLPFAPPPSDGKRRLCLDPSPTSTGVCTDLAGTIAFWHRDFKGAAQTQFYGWEGRFIQDWNRFVAYELTRIEADEMAIELPGAASLKSIWDGGAVITQFWNAVAIAQNLGVGLQMTPSTSLKVHALGAGNGHARWKDHLGVVRAWGHEVTKADEAVAVALAMWARSA